MGDSGGRSAGNRTGDGAKRRATPRERAGIDPPQDELERAFPVALRAWRVYALTLGVVVLLLLAILVVHAR
jgi:hypothetical protein